MIIKPMLPASVEDLSAVPVLIRADEVDSSVEWVVEGV